MAVQPDGKIVVAGLAEPQFGGLARFEPDGTLDRGFGEHGVVVDRRFSAFTAVAVEPDGKIVAAAWQAAAKDPEQRPILGRFLADGRPDPDFGQDGAVFLSRHPSSGFDPKALLVRADGSVLIGGTYRDDYGLPTRGVVERVGPGGEDLGPVAEALQPSTVPGEMALQWTGISDLLARPDGSLLIAGTADGFLGGSTQPLLGRFPPASPVPDPSFGGGRGLFRPGYDPQRGYENERADTLIADGDGFLVGGSTRGRMSVSRFDADGNFDRGWGESGISNPKLGNRDGTEGSRSARTEGLAIAPDGGVVAVATNLNPEYPGSHGLPCEENCPEAILARFGPDGALDRGFGGRGLLHIFGGGRQRLTEAGDVAVLPDGSILVSGQQERRRYTGVRRSLLVSRFHADGSLDRSFGRDGVATATPCPGSQVERRRAGCLPSARVEFDARGLAGRSPALRVEIRPNKAWARIWKASLLLPRQLRARIGSPVTFTVIDDGRPERRHMSAERGEAYPRVIPIGYILNSRRIVLAIPHGCLKRVGPGTSGEALVFRLKVSFRGAGTQEIAIRRSP